MSGDVGPRVPDLVREALAAGNDGTFRGAGGEHVVVETGGGVREMRYVPAGSAEPDILFYHHDATAERPAALPEELPFLAGLSADLALYRGTLVASWRPGSDADVAERAPLLNEMGPDAGPMPEDVRRSVAAVRDGDDPEGKGLIATVLSWLGAERLERMRALFQPDPADLEVLGTAFDRLAEISRADGWAPDESAPSVSPVRSLTLRRSAASRVLTLTGFGPMPMVSLMERPAERGRSVGVD